MRFNGLTNASSHVASDAHVEGDLFFLKELHKLNVLFGSDAVTDTFNTKFFNSYPYGLCSGDFTRVGRESKTALFCLFVNGGVRTGWEVLLASAESDSNNAFPKIRRRSVCIGIAPSM